MLVDYFENDCLKLKNFCLRNLIILIRRFKEIFDIFFYNYAIKIKGNMILFLYSNS